MKKPLIYSIMICSICFFLLGCNSTEEKDPETSLTSGTEINTKQLMDYSAMLNDTDEEAIALLGEGQPSFQENSENISSRLYQSNILGFTGETILIYGDEENPTINEVLLTFYGAKFSDVVDAISEQLGDAVYVRSDEVGGADAQWKQESVIYNLTSYADTVMLGIWKDYTFKNE